ncbi:histidine phosphatase family protein [Bradyrhizobium sp. LHD-71]|uniref:SixA phosphatase family protein n=1 Tax=Bradyrhizobium sp. LHD-71 TaxID=3072141 RepID=UPI00280EB359|nr:histidine phosphatase family protein [Bradyrhizobium sp. LHD-71]MDQ8728532.1 histidine phosphatase family protein [Bradyrhizobium sp. LHD-71]
MRRLILLRHAKTERESLSGLDRDRRLDTRGRADAPVIGRYLAEHKLVPDLVLVSPATRTRETWDLLAAALNKVPAAEIVPDLYGAGASDLLQIIRMAVGRADDRTLKSMMVVAHNPGLHELSFALIGKARAADREELEENLPTSGLAVFKFAIDDWSDVSVRCGTLERFVTPKLLRFQSEGS